MKTSILANDQTQAQNDLDDLFTELRSTMGRMKPLGFEEIFEYLAPEDFGQFW